MNFPSINTLWKLLTLVLSRSFKYTEWDPVGVICTVDTDDVTPMQGVYILLDDEGDYTIMSLELNFRSKSQFMVLFFHLSD